MLTVIRDLIQVDREKDCASADAALELGRQQLLYVKPWSSYPSWVGSNRDRGIGVVRRIGRRGGNGRVSWRALSIEYCATSSR
ncbi:hypothetical protein CSOJ01_15929 [Colletotrichum sojae]|uniref:Uncharacterized protein n=1 Tax=Colletotrichum sojae TaxID=2175907 RepID=A0A8H6ILL9_9PEZI|nr:hypothetical protein CSOJ01_15929 [Colletotrichum sojae]